MESIPQLADLGASFLRILVKAKNGDRELVAEISVGEAADRVVAAHEGREDLAVGEKCARCAARRSVDPADESPAAEAGHRFFVPSFGAWKARPNAERSASLT